MAEDGLADLRACANVVGIAAAFVMDFLDDEDDTEWEKVTVVMDDYVRIGDPSFRRHFRLTRKQCDTLYGVLRRHIEQNNVNVELQACGHPFTHQLLMVLWIMATPDSFRSVALRFGVYKNDVHRYYVKIITALRQLAPQFVSWPNREERYQIKTCIQGYSDFPGVVGMVDGRHFVISKPKNEPAAFRNHHHSYSIKAQAVCDHRLLVRDFYVGECGSLHDARVFRRSHLCRNILYQADLIERDEHIIIGDAAYTLRDRVLTPFPQNGHLTPAQRNYNYLHARSRCPVERTFGDLTVVWRRNYFFHSGNMDYAIDHIVASFVLHNFRILHGDRYPLVRPMREELEDELVAVLDDPFNDDGEMDILARVPDPYVPQGDGAQLLEMARLRGAQKRWGICNALPNDRNEKLPGILSPT